MLSSQFIGIWMCVDDDSSVRVSVSKDNSNKVKVCVTDLYDGEVLEVSNVKTTSRTLSFDCVVPSTGYRTKNSLVLQGDGTCRYKLTVFETWVKVSSQESLQGD